jgi:hypothetical protein
MQPADFENFHDHVNPALWPWLYSGNMGDLICVKDNYLRPASKRHLIVKEDTFLTRYQNYFKDGSNAVYPANSQCDKG